MNKEKKIVYEIGKWKPPKDKQFKKWVRPPVTNEQKRAGRERKREKERIMKNMMKYQDMTVEQFNKLMEKLKDPQWMKKLTVWEARTANLTKAIINDSKFWLERMDRHVSKAPTEITAADWEPLFDKSMKERTAEEVMEYYLTNIKNKK